MSVIDLIKVRKEIVYKENEGIKSAVYLINEFNGRTFSFKGLKKKYSGLTGQELIERVQEEIDNMLIMYRYKTKAKKHIDSKGNKQLRIKIVGKAGMMTRYNPLDIVMNIKTER